MFWVPFTSHFIFGPQNLWAAHDDELFGHPKAIPTLISTGQKLSHIFWFDTFFLSAKYLHRFWHRIVCAEKRDLRNCENHILPDATRNPFLSLEMSEKFDAKMNNMRQLKSGSSETDAVSLTKKNSGSQISTKIRPFFFPSCVFFLIAEGPILCWWNQLEILWATGVFSLEFWPGGVPVLTDLLFGRRKWMSNFPWWCPVMSER